MRQIFDNWCRFVVARGIAFIAMFLPIVFNPYAKASFEPAKVTCFRWAAGAIVFSFVLHKIVTRDSTARADALLPRGSERLLLVCVLVYGAVHVVATILSVDPNQSVWGFGAAKHGTLTTLTLVVFFFIARWSLDTEEQLERVGTAIIVGSVPVTLYGIVQALGIDPLAWTTDSVSHVHSTMGRSNFLGAYLSMVIPFVLARIALARSEREVAVPFLVVLALLQVTTILATQARAAWLGVIVAMVLFTATVWWPRNRRACLWACTTVLALGVGLLLVLNRVDLLRAAGLKPPRGETTQTFREMRADTIDSRFRIWRSTLTLVPERWLIGFGPETFPTVVAERHPSLAFPVSGTLRLTDPHNVLLSELFAAGVLGLAAFLAVVGSFFIAAADRKRAADTDARAAAVAATLAATVAYLIHSQFSPDVIVLSVFFWMIMAMGGSGRGSGAGSAQATVAPSAPAPKFGARKSSLR